MTHKIRVTTYGRAPKKKKKNEKKEPWAISSTLITKTVEPLPPMEIDFMANVIRIEQSIAKGSTMESCRPPRSDCAAVTQN